MPQPGSQPPTPTRFTSAASAPSGEERAEHGDLIKFYNTVYVLHMKDFAMKFAKSRKISVSLLRLARSR